MDLSSGGSIYIQREDFENEILTSLYPATFCVKWLPKLILDSVRLFLFPRMNQVRA